MNPYYLGYDTETDLIGINSIVPDLICSTFYDLQTLESDILHWSPKKEHGEVLCGMYGDENCHIIIHNAAFDASVCVRSYPETFPLIWKAYREGRIHCTMIREMLLNLATTGSIDSVAISGTNKQMRYGLADLLLQYTGVDISASKDMEDAVRLNYALVKDVPLCDWPAEFVQYAKDDPRHHAEVFLAQQVRRDEILAERGIDAFKTEGFRAMAHFALTLQTKHGNRLDPVEVLRVTKEFQELYNDQDLVQPLIKAGFVIPAVPAQPNKLGTRQHKETCPGNAAHPEYKKSKAVKDCDCPVKMNKAQPERGSDLAVFDYIWKAARENPLLEVWPSDGLLEQLKAEDIADRVLDGGKIDLAAVEQMSREAADQAGMKDIDVGARPNGWNIKVDKEWLANFAYLDPVMEKYAERSKVEKIVTSYLPKLYWAEGYDQCPDVLPGREGRLDGKVPAARVHSSFSPLKETGRCSSRAATKGRGKNTMLLYPSWNGQQVDPRVRGCVIPDEGNVLFSIDYSAMELGTAAQVAYSLFGYSVLRDKINAGIDTHAYLGAQIAYELDPYFKGACESSDRDAVFECFSSTKGFKEKCDSERFAAIKGSADATWDDFFKHYRKFAKPTGLGYPGGLGPATFISYAKGTYGVTVDLETATLLREVWRGTYPELKEGLEYVWKKCVDPWAAPEYVEQEGGKFKKREWYCYTTPLGMHRARCAFTACANGMFLQSPSAEGALSGVCEIMEACSVGGLAGRVWPTIFIHDEMFGEIVEGPGTTADVMTLSEIMVRNMRKITPDVRAGVEPCLMRRWSKAAEPVWEEVSGQRVLRVWEPKKEKG
jgi:hypothetical protein